MAKATVRIANCAGFWGDSRQAARQVLTAPGIDYLVSDYLAEITMALLARVRAKDPEGGFIQDAVDTFAPLLGELHERGIKIVTNAGALNPRGCAAAIAAAAAEASIELRVAAVEGDDLLPRRDELLAGSPTDMFTGEPIPAGVSTLNAYLGARPIAHALAAGADVVVTGRCNDAAVVLGPLMHEFGWSDGDHDLLAAGALVGHIVECGPQCTGGLFTDWRDVPDWENIGFPIADCRPDGSATITKADGTGGLVTPGTVGEQILYEIGDPGAYVLPDVVCDWREVRLRQAGTDVVEVSGARGSAPTASYKVTATHHDGYRSIATAMFAGIDADGRARRAGEEAVARTERLLAEAGHEPLTAASIEVIGAPTEAVLKVGVRHADRDALRAFTDEFVSFGLIAQGMAGVFGGRPRIAPVFRVLHLLTPKADVDVTVAVGDEAAPVAVSPGDPDAHPGTEPIPDGGAPPPPADGITVPLRAIAFGRSGDKGNNSNIGLMARRPEFAAVIREQVTCERVAAVFADVLRGDVVRWELPGLHAINYVLTDVLGGSGGTSSLRFDPQGKSYAAMLLELPVIVPAEWSGSLGRR